MIRPVKLEDSQQIASIYNYYIEHTLVTFEQVPLTSAQMEARLSSVLNEGGLWFVSEEQGHVNGYAYSTPWGTREGYRTSVEATVYLSAEHTGKGLGFSLYSHLLEQLRAMQIHSVIGVIGLPNPGSVKLHEKLGFEKVAGLKEIGRKFDTWVDVGYWQRLF